MRKAALSRVFVLLFVIFILLQLSACGVMVRTADRTLTDLKNSHLFNHGRHGELSNEEKIWAKTAWNYFKNNYNAGTGLVNSVDKYHSSTMWHMADNLAALVAAYELELIDRHEFDGRLSQFLRFLNTMPLFMQRLPNKVYHTKTGKKVDFNNQQADLGWSAIDIGRLLIWLKIIKTRYSEFSEYVDKGILRWDFCEVINDEGSLFGGSKIGNKIELYQEGRLGYEEYAALGFQLWGFDTSKASSIEPYEVVKVNGIDIYYDKRDPRETGTYSPVLTGPYLYSGLEFNWDKINDTSSMDSVHSDTIMATQAEIIYQVQETRYQQEKIFTARTDHQLSVPPYFVFDSIFAAGYPWNTLSDSGESLDRLAMISTRAVFGMWVLWKTAYTEQLILMIKELYDSKRGWYEGRYERHAGYDRTITASTNAMVLETLLYKVQGKLILSPLATTHKDVVLNDYWRRPQSCFPEERRGISK